MRDLCLAKKYQNDAGIPRGSAKEREMTFVKERRSEYEEMAPENSHGFLLRIKLFFSSALFFLEIYKSALKL